VSITNQTGTHVLTADRYYDDRKCWGSFDMFWGNWVYNVTPYIQENYTYWVKVKNVNATGSVCPAGPGIVILYRDETKPLIDYWINEGGDLLEVKNGYLRKSEAITNASFEGCSDGYVVNASIGLVNPWANSYADGSEVFFNGISLGQDVYCGGYGHPYYCNRSRSTIDMETNVGDSSAEVAISLLDVKDHLNDCDNYAGMGDIKDLGALPANAFLVLEYGEPAPFRIFGWVNYTDGSPVNDPDVVITNLNTSEVFIAETAPGSNYYQVMTTASNVSAGNVLHFNASNGNSTEFNHTVTQAEMSEEELEQNITIQYQPGTCGDVNDDDRVTMGDGRRIYMNQLYGAEDYPIANAWAADVNCDTRITMGDGRKIYMNQLYGAEQYPLNCCT